MTKQPTDTIRDGHLKATIWNNESDKGSFHSVSLARTYEDKDGNLKDSHSFSASDLLRVSELARSAYGRSKELRQDESRDQNCPDKAEGGTKDREAFQNSRRETRAPQPLREK